MALDPSIILQGRSVQLDNPIDTQNKLAQLQQVRNQNRLADISFADNQRERAGENSLSQLLADGKSGEDVVRGLAAQGYGKSGLAYGKQFQERQKATADISKVQADTLHLGAQTSETQAKVMNLAAQQHKDAIGLVNDRETAAGWLQSMYNDPRLKDIVGASGTTIDQAIARIPSDAAGLEKWKMQAALGGDKLIEMTTPDANARLSAKTAKYSADSSAHTARERLVFDRSKEEGNAPSDLSESSVDAIGQGRMKAPTGYALRNPKIANLMDRVNAKYPNFDATEYDAKQKAMRDFSTGTPGNSIRSFSTATDHLSQLDQLVDALGNGNVPLANKISNLVAQNTGSTAPTNFDAVKGIVAKEVLKSIVAGGGGVEERQELSHLLDNAKTTKQLKGVIVGYLHLMSAQKDNLEQQYELSTGRKDAKTRFNYKKEAAAAPNPVAPPAGSAPSDIDALLKKYGGK
ncbi:hypothetical protein SAMN05880566_102232 [Janthinobacterium sp. TND4EL3]|uniref:hypothetical protein n=1 Tax=Janthinobacterium sp. TND4EL3 TaxID=1907311 RepID=UPI0009558960|nr:hypothetical protein [Janthinobacterium sp. TND4EL3]SIQ22143.1 hypothetical protein SAMN05880566_102232 [Janthinobacterium sp. TND4EL3]